MTAGALGVSMAVAVFAWAGHAAGASSGLDTHPSSTVVTNPAPGSVATNSPRSTSSGSGSASTSLVSATSASENWSGLAALGSAERSVRASWTAPSFTQADVSANSAIGEWVGLGGMRSHQLIQVGTLTEPGPKGEAQTVAFFEQLPNAAVDTITIPTGATVMAAITPVGTDRWRLELTVAGSSSPAVDTVVTLSPSAASGVETSAEWITEAPTSQAGIMNLAPVSTTVMRHVEANGAPLAELPSGTLQAISMVDQQGVTIAAPTVSPSSDSVTVTTQYDATSGLGSGSAATAPFAGNGFGFQAPGFGGFGFGYGYSGYGSSGFGYGFGGTIVGA
ncbi:hypothetical protein Afer_1170 [Acidimicrobium ferrooxidans DSM 10331]|uniref:Uncharacterized protein n=1 Tax=Acidimicrobium ferrooxidans (strain DSM 10331 / JCM 15462 / NBRC 103882 / ICP) TaxID=525909 RepID=C7LZE4_ACIFD|nr:hypothetical protein Afer_1170 [Acidimicrobium ferrooxidans DSM 10331]